jgi:hypothetical protein
VTISIARLRWAGLVVRMEVCVRRRPMYMQPEKLRQVRRPCITWREEVAKDARVLGIRSWWALAENREEWRKLLSKAKELYDLYSRRRRCWCRWWWSPHWYGSVLFLFLAGTSAAHIRSYLRTFMRLYFRTTERSLARRVRGVAKSDR